MNSNLENTCIVIFGASEDLAQRKLMPAFYHLLTNGLMPVGNTFSPFSSTSGTRKPYSAALAVPWGPRKRTSYPKNNIGRYEIGSTPEPPGRTKAALH